jgi:F-type H+-transporting ATPase subunit gamma
VTERLREVTAHIQGVRQLGTVVTAMRGVAAARAQQSRGLLPGIRAYAASIAASVAQALRLLPPQRAARRHGPQALVLFAAEQGFAGAFSDHVLDVAGAEAGSSVLFVVGSRGARRAEERHLAPAWQTAMAAHPASVPTSAERVLEALYQRLDQEAFSRVRMVFPIWSPAHGLRIERRSLLPLDPSHFADLPPADVPLVTLPPEELLQQLAEEYVYSQLCEAAMHAFAAENEARTATMQRAKTRVEDMLASLQAEERRVRQEDITAEVIELSTSRIAAGQVGDRPVVLH